MSNTTGLATFFIAEVTKQGLTDFVYFRIYHWMQAAIMPHCLLIIEAPIVTTHPASCRPKCIIATWLQFVIGIAIVLIELLLMNQYLWDDIHQ